jgi:hypothetical protein
MRFVPLAGHMQNFADPRARIRNILAPGRSLACSPLASFLQRRT